MNVQIIKSYCRKKLAEEFSETNQSQVRFWMFGPFGIAGSNRTGASFHFWATHGFEMAIRIQEITCYLEHYQLLNISRPEQFKKFLKGLKKRRGKMEVNRKRLKNRFAYPFGNITSVHMTSVHITHNHITAYVL